ncbi:out at first protein [Aplysia californica]|uniref:Out at first protein n=1 Tax=Aplysia californica TaxID=6500 RepID=A0ABM0K984_APLCA|nr:out at first protein [Aplysia californica]
MAHLHFCICMLLAALVSYTTAQLIVNVRNKGGETVVEKILANTTADTVTLEFLNSDGSLVTQFIDFKSEVQIFRIYVLGEEELGSTKPQAMCFITRFLRNDFISSDAMSKLRQKNPTAIRTPEEEKEMSIHSLDLMVNLDKGHVLSPHVFNICSEATDGIFAQETDLRTISKSLAKDYITLISSTSELVPSKHPRCRDTSDIGRPCACELRTCIGWYPCGLKYCHGKDTGGRVVSYRCGIKTCKRCLSFVYVAKLKTKCLWDF